MDNAGRMHAVGCEEPAAEAHQADEDADGAPVFSTATVELPFTATSDDAPKNVAIGAGALVEAPVKPAKKTRTSVTAPLFAKDEILKKYAEVKDALEKLGKMLEASL
jgi:type III secretion system FlhB-like substrate exporter